MRQNSHVCLAQPGCHKTSISEILTRVRGDGGDAEAYPLNPSQEVFHRRSPGLFLWSVVTVLKGIPVALWRSGSLPPMHPAPTVPHCAVAARFPRPPRMGSASLAQVHG